MGRANALSPASALVLVDIDGGICVSKLFKFYLKVLCDGQGAVRQATLYAERFFLN